MILYLDTSSLVKLYVPEMETAAVKRDVDAAEVVATSSLAYVEARAAFARKRRERDVSVRDYRDLVQDFDHDWESYLIVDVSNVLVKSAGRLAEKHALRGYDAVHLASAVTIRREGDRSVSFSCFDARLSRAARREGLKITL
jgi:predicted nucleic acid-binding protein